MYICPAKLNNLFVSTMNFFQKNERTMIYSVSPELNERIAEELLEAIGTRNYFSGSVRVVSDDDVECTLRTSCVVYRRDRKSVV